MKQLLEIYTFSIVFLWLFWYALFKLVGKKMFDIIGLSLLIFCMLIPYIGDYLP